MEKIISYCGFTCSECPAYAPNIKSLEDQKTISSKWHEFYGFLIPPEAIICDGCHIPDSENPRRISMKCNIRACAIEKSAANCSECSEFICDSLDKHFGEFEKSEQKLSEKISQADFDKYVKPYCGRKILQSLSIK